MLGQAAFVLDHMLDGVRRRRQLGEDEDGSEEQVAQEIHGDSLIDLNEETLEVFTLGEIQRDRMISGAREATHDARLTAGIDGRAGDDFLEQFQPDAAGAGIGHQQTTRPQQAETEDIDVLVGPRGPVGVRG